MHSCIQGKYYIQSHSLSVDVLFAGENHKEFKILILTMLAAYYLRCSNDNTKAPTEDEKSKFREQANVLHNRADREDMMNQSNLLGKSFM